MVGGCLVLISLASFSDVSIVDSLRDVVLNVDELLWLWPEVRLAWCNLHQSWARHPWAPPPVGPGLGL